MANRKVTQGKQSMRWVWYNDFYRSLNLLSVFIFIFILRCKSEISFDDWVLRLSYDQYLHVISNRGESVIFHFDFPS